MLTFVKFIYEDISYMMFFDAKRQKIGFDAPGRNLGETHNFSVLLNHVISIGAIKQDNDGKWELAIQKETCLDV